MNLFNDVYTPHTYILATSGLNIKDKYFNTRREAEIAMHKICHKYGISVECTEQDKHERKYSNHCGVRFYINRI